MKKRIISLLLVISLAITSLMLVSCEYTHVNDGTIYGDKYENSENYKVGNCKINYNEFDEVQINWEIGDISIKQTQNAYIGIYENVRDAIEPYKMHYIIEDRVLKVQFWESNYSAKLLNEGDKDLTIELPATMDGNLKIDSVSSNIVCSGSLKLNNGEFENISGKIELRDIATKTLKVSSISGNVDIYRLDAKSASISSISGNLSVSLKSIEELSIESISGNINLKLNLVGATIDFNTVSGNYYAENDAKKFGNGAAKIDAETISGNLEIN